MLKSWMSRVRKDTKRKRLLEYERQLELVKDNLFDGRRTPGLLTTLWRTIDLDDLLVFTAQDRISLSFSLRHANLKLLVEFFENFNELIVHEKSGLIEQLVSQNFQVFKGVDLDLYFSDDKGRPVDERQLLTALKGQLLQHVTILDGFSNQYYQRLGSSLYTEIYNMTDQLVNMVKQKELRKPTK